MAQYAWRPGRGYKADPAEAQEVFVKLKETVGLTPANVLKEAKKKGSALHSDFEWDNEKAAHEYRLVQARQMIRAVVLVVDEVNPRDGENLWIHTTTESGDKVYERPEVIVRNPTMLANAIREAKQYLEAGGRRWSQIQSVSRGFEAAKKAFDEEVEK
jgi:hypothetical protein